MRRGKKTTETASNGQIYSGIFYTLSFGILFPASSRYRISNHQDHITNAASPHPPPSEQAILPPRSAHRLRILPEHSPMAGTLLLPTPTPELQVTALHAPTPCNFTENSLSITFSGLRSRDFCRVGKTKSLNSE